MGGSPLRGKSVADLDIKIEGHPTQVDFINDTNEVAFFVSGRGGGKTWGAAEKAVLFFLSNITPKDRVLTRICVTAPTYRMLYDAAIPTYEEVLRKHNLLIPEEGKGQIIKSTTSDGPKIILRQGIGEILFRSTEDPDRLRGMTVAAVHMDEAAQSSEEAYSILQGTLRQAGKNHQLWGSTTPRGYNNWVWRAIQDGAALYQCEMEDNTYLPPDFVARLKKEYSGEWAEQELKGQFTTILGQCRFDAMTLRRVLEIAPPPLYTEGPVSVYKEPIVGRKYVAGGDAAEGLEHGDYTVAQILDAQTGEQVCVIRGKIPPDDFAELVNHWCNKYNKAMWNEPRDMIDIAVLDRLKDLNYPNIAYSEKGWKTTSLWKSMAEAELSEAITKSELILYDKQTIQELLTYIKDEKHASCRAADGCHDDTVAALMVAWQARKVPGAYTRRIAAYDYVKWR